MIFKDTSWRSPGNKMGRPGVLQSTILEPLLCVRCKQNWIFLEGTRILANMGSSVSWHSYFCLQSSWLHRITVLAYMDFLTKNVLIIDRVNMGLNGARALLCSSMFQDTKFHWIMNVRLLILFIFQSVSWTNTDNMNTPTVTFNITRVSHLQKFI